MCAVSSDDEKPENFKGVRNRSFTVLNDENLYNEENQIREHKINNLSDTSNKSKNTSIYHKNCIIPNINFNINHNSIGNKFQTNIDKEFFNKVGAKLKSISSYKTKEFIKHKNIKIANTENRRMEAAERSRPMFITTVKSGKFLEPPPEVAALLGLQRKNSESAWPPNSPSEIPKMLYSFSSKPRILKSNTQPPLTPNSNPSNNARKKRNAPNYSEDTNSTLQYGNTMYDRRVARGSNFVSSQQQPFLIESNTNRHSEATRRAAIRHRAQQRARRIGQRTPPPVDGRRHLHVQTENIMEELIDNQPEIGKSCRASRLVSKIPAYKETADAETQIHPNDLPECEPDTSMISIMVKRIIQESIIDITKTVENPISQNQTQQDLRIEVEKYRSNGGNETVILTAEQLSNLITAAVERLKQSSNNFTELDKHLENFAIFQRRTLREIQKTVTDLEFITEIMKRTVTKSNQEASFAGTYATGDYTIEKQNQISSDDAVDQNDIEHTNLEDSFQSDYSSSKETVVEMRSESIETVNRINETSIGITDLENEKEETAMEYETEELKDENYEVRDGEIINPEVEILKNTKIENEDRKEDKELENSKHKSRILEIETGNSQNGIRDAVISDSPNMELNRNDSQTMVKNQEDAKLQVGEGKSNIEERENIMDEYETTRADTEYDDVNQNEIIENEDTAESKDINIEYAKQQDKEDRSNTEGTENTIMDEYENTSTGTEDDIDGTRIMQNEDATKSEEQMDGKDKMETRESAVEDENQNIRDSSPVKVVRGKREIESSEKRDTDNYKDGNEILEGNIEKLENGENSTNIYKKIQDVELRGKPKSGSIKSKILESNKNDIEKTEILTNQNKYIRRMEENPEESSHNVEHIEITASDGENHTEDNIDPKEENSENVSDKNEISNESEKDDLQISKHRGLDERVANALEDRSISGEQEKTDPTETSESAYFEGLRANAAVSSPYKQKRELLETIEKNEKFLQEERSYYWKTVIRETNEDINKNINPEEISDSTESSNEELRGARNHLMNTQSKETLNATSEIIDANNNVKNDTLFNNTENKSQNLIEPIKGNKEPVDQPPHKHSNNIDIKDESLASNINSAPKNIGNITDYSEDMKIDSISNSHTRNTSTPPAQDSVTKADNDDTINFNNGINTDNKTDNGDNSSDNVDGPDTANNISNSTIINNSVDNIGNEIKNTNGDESVNDNTTNTGEDNFRGNNNDNVDNIDSRANNGDNDSKFDNSDISSENDDIGSGENNNKNKSNDNDTFHDNDNNSGIAENNVITNNDDNVGDNYNNEDNRGTNDGKSDNDNFGNISSAAESNDDNIDNDAGSENTNNNRSNNNDNFDNTGRIADNSTAVNNDNVDNDAGSENTNNNKSNNNDNFDNTSRISDNSTAVNNDNVDNDAGSENTNNNKSNNNDNFDNTSRIAENNVIRNNDDNIGDNYTNADQKDANDSKSDNDKDDIRSTAENTVNIDNNARSENTNNNKSNNTDNFHNTIRITKNNVIRNNDDNAGNNYTNADNKDTIDINSDNDNFDNIRSTAENTDVNVDINDPNANQADDTTIDNKYDNDNLNNTISIAGNNDNIDINISDDTKSDERIPVINNDNNDDDDDDDDDNDINSDKSDDIDINNTDNNKSRIDSNDNYGRIKEDDNVKNDPNMEHVGVGINNSIFSKQINLGLPKNIINSERELFQKSDLTKRNDSSNSDNTDVENKNYSLTNGNYSAENPQTTRNAELMENIENFENGVNKEILPNRSLESENISESSNLISWTNKEIEHREIINEDDKIGTKNNFFNKQSKITFGDDSYDSNENRNFEIVRSEKTTDTMKENFINTKETIIEEESEISTSVIQEIREKRTEEIIIETTTVINTPNGNL